MFFEHVEDTKQKSPRDLNQKANFRNVLKTGKSFILSALHPVDIVIKE